MNILILVEMFVIALLTVAGIREACNEKEPKWLRWCGHLVGAIGLVILVLMIHAV